MAKWYFYFENQEWYSYFGGPKAMAEFSHQHKVSLTSIFMTKHRNTKTTKHKNTQITKHKNKTNLSWLRTRTRLWESETGGGTMSKREWESQGGGEWEVQHRDKEENDVQHHKNTMGTSRREELSHSERARVRVMRRKRMRGATPWKGGEWKVQCRKN